MIEQSEYGTLAPTGEAVAVIMAGGSGTRFWPWSRKGRPKQYLPLGQGERSLIQQTVDRVVPICGAHGAMIVTGHDQVGLVREQLPEVGILAEPCARNTAACVGYAAIRVLDRVGDLPMLCLPADHLIQQQAAVLELYQRGIAAAAANDVLVTFGIRPTAPVTGYGYIHAKATGSDQLVSVEAFVEKPNRARAEEYLLSGQYFWNSGMFVWRPSVILAAIERFVPELYRGLQEIREAFSAHPERLAALYQALPSVSIDVGVMEKALNVKMLPGDHLGWSDVGSWEAWFDTKESVSAGNCVIGDAVVIDAEGCAVLAKDRLLALVGVKDLIVVDSGDAVLICDRQHTQDVKKVVDYLKQQEREELL